MKSKKISFQGAFGDTLSARLDRPEEGAVKGWVLFAHGFSIGKDLKPIRTISKALGTAPNTQSLAWRCSTKPTNPHTSIYIHTNEKKNNMKKETKDTTLHTHHLSLLLSKLMRKVKLNSRLIFY